MLQIDDSEIDLSQVASKLKTLECERDYARDLLAQMVASAYPHPVENPMMHAVWTEARELLLENAERIHGGAGLTNQPETPAPLDGASC